MAMPEQGADGPRRTERHAAFRNPPASAAEALARARQHARSAASEALACVHALLDAGSLASLGSSAEASRLLAPVAQLLESAALALSPDSDAVSAPLLSALAEALDAEIARWEARARDDAEARAVLRAFLGVRELLWELGLRRSDTARGPSAAEARAPRAGEAPRGPRPLRRRPRVQRVPVQG
jgi:hypothetical protein